MSRVRWKKCFSWSILSVCFAFGWLVRTNFCAVDASDPSQDFQSVQSPFALSSVDSHPALIAESNIFHDNIWNTLAQENGARGLTGKKAVGPYAVRHLSSSRVIAVPAQTATVNTCSSEDVSCFCWLGSSVSEKELANCEAIRALHGTLDDDANGNIDLTESVDFIREELEIKNGDERRQQRFHNEDTQVTAKELWEAWVKSDVHNWTVAQCVDWLTYSVQLPQYAPAFVDHGVDGANLPRLTVVNMSYLSSVLGIKDPHHKRKISLKATDAVLFGPPKDGNNAVKDAILIGLLLAALSGCYIAYFINKRSKRHLEKLTRDLESLATAEKALEELQARLSRALEEQNTATDANRMDPRVVDSHSSDSESGSSRAQEETIRLKAEIEVLRYELQQMQGELEDRCWKGPPDLQHWLQLTYELETKAYNKKRLQAEKQLEQAKEACEKLGKRGSSLFGAFASTHGRSIDEVDRSIMEARSALTEVTLDLQERASRWKQIELLCGFSITNNPGLNHLEMLLRSGVGNRRGYVYVPSAAGLNGTPGEEDDASSIHNPSAGTEVRSRNSATARKTLVKRDSSSSLESAGTLANALALGQIHATHLPSMTNGFAGSKKTKASSQVLRPVSQPADYRDHYENAQNELDLDIPSFQVKPVTSMPLTKSVSLNPSVPKPLPANLRRQPVPSDALPSLSSSSSALYKPSPTLSERNKRAAAIQKSYSQETEPLDPKLPVRNSQSESALDVSQVPTVLPVFATSDPPKEDRHLEETLSIKSSGSSDEHKKPKRKVFGNLFSKSRKHKLEKS